MNKENIKTATKDWSQLVKLRNITSDEYDLLCDATNEDDNIMHWNKMWSITQTFSSDAMSYCVVRGCGPARDALDIGVSKSGSGAGFRPAFEALEPDTDCADLSVGDVVVVGTLYVGENPVRVPAKPFHGGDVTAYDEDGDGFTPKIILDTALDDPGYQVKAVYVGNGVFVCDRVMLNWISAEAIVDGLLSEDSCEFFFRAVEKAYQTLVNCKEGEEAIAIEEAIGFLGEALQ